MTAFHPPPLRNPPPWLPKLQKAAMLSAMLAALCGSAWMLGGLVAVAACLCAGMAGALAILRIPAAMVMDMHRADPVAPTQWPAMHATVAALAGRAGLKTPPALYRLPGDGVNALAVGRSGNSAIGLSEDAITTLSARELRAVVAHEISHIAAGDTRLMALTCLLGKLTRCMAQFSLIAAAVLAVSAGSSLLSPHQILVFLTVIPLASLLQLALSRHQEYAADLGTLRLTRDGIGLVAALEHIESPPSGRRRRRGARRPLAVAFAALLRSHPSPRRRIAFALDHLYGESRVRSRLAQPVLGPATRSLHRGEAARRTPGACAGPAG